MKIGFDPQFILKHNITGGAHVVLPELIPIIRKMDGCCETLYVYFAVSCDDPIQANATGTYSDTREGTIVTYQCNEGFRPSATMLATCTSTMQWVPPIITCIIVTGELQIL